MAPFGSQFEPFMVAGFGIILQSSVIVYAMLIRFIFPSISLFESAQRGVPVNSLSTCVVLWEGYFVVDMYLCSSIIERSTAEQPWEIKK